MRSWKAARADEVVGPASEEGGHDRMRQLRVVPRDVEPGEERPHRGPRHASRALLRDATVGRRNCAAARAPGFELYPYGSRIVNPCWSMRDWRTKRVWTARLVRRMRAMAARAL